MGKCNRCKKEKQLSQFIKNKQCKNGYAGTCKECQNEYSKKWKHLHSKELSKKRRKRYSETAGLEVKKREVERKKKYPLRVRCQLLRGGMRERAKIKNIEFDSDYFTVNYLMGKLLRDSNCECCGKKLDIGFKKYKKASDNSPSMDRVNSQKGYTKENTAVICWGCNKRKQDSTSKQLRIIADFIDARENEVECDVNLN